MEPTESVTPPGDDRVWQLQLIYHPDVSWVGARADIGTVALDRGCSAFGAGVFEGAGVSRQHASCELGDSGLPQLEDRGSRNGTFVNGLRVEAAALRAGDVVGLGRLLFLVVHEPPRILGTPPVEMVAESASLRQSWASATAGLQRGAVLVWGPAGTGKRTFAHALAGTDGATVPLETAVRAGGGVCSFAEVADVERHEQQALAAALRDTPVVVVGDRSVEACRAALHPELFEGLGCWPVRLAPLHERPSELAPLVLHFLRRYGGDACRPTPELMFALVRHRWPGNLAELESVVERAVVESDDEQVGVFADLRHLLSAPRSTRDASRGILHPPTDVFRFARDGKAFQVPGGEPVDMSRKEVLARMLAVFVEARQRWPGRALPVPELIMRCWPGEKMKPQAGSNRVYVALATLRKLGLRDVLLRDDGGYLLDPDVPVVLD